MGLREKIKSQRERRKRSIRIKIEGTAERPRLTVYKSLKYISAQIVDDSKGITLASASSQEKDIKSGKNVDIAKEIGKTLASRAKDKNINELRKENNITVAELAKELGISQSMLTNYENGNGTPRDDSIWDRLSQLFGVSKSHVMGLTTDIDVVHRKKKFKAVVDMSEPISIQVENQTDIDILTKLDLLDDEDTNKVLDFINNLLTIKKYEGIEDSPIEYVTK